MKLTLELGVLIICVLLLLVLVASQYTKQSICDDVEEGFSNKGSKKILKRAYNYCLKKRDEDTCSKLHDETKTTMNERFRFCLNAFPKRQCLKQYKRYINSCTGGNTSGRCLKINR